MDYHEESYRIIRIAMENHGIRVDMMENHGMMGIIMENLRVMGMQFHRMMRFAM